MSVVLQVSDPHFGTERVPVVEALVQLTAQQRPNLVVLSGDITQRARPEQFRAARAFINRLGAPVLAIPGNHDIPLLALGIRLLDPYARYCEAFGDTLEPMHTSSDLLVLCVNTTRWWRHKNGEVSTAQIKYVTARLARADAAQLRIVVVHHPIAVTRDEDVHNRLRGYLAAQKSWAAAGADLVMGGHIHLPYVMALTGLARPMWAVQAGTAVSSRTRQGVPNSVNMVRCGHHAASGCCVIEQWDYDATPSAFVRGTVTEVTTQRAGNVY
jgi:3',5'-cyclic AMP phosphodiesterase CpdA